MGAAFLRHESKFYLYALYNKNKPKSDSLMSEYGTSFFKVSPATAATAVYSVPEHIIMSVVGMATCAQAGLERRDKYSGRPDRIAAHSLKAGWLDGRPFGSDHLL